MKDWAGNDIEAGDVIVMVRTTDYAWSVVGEYPVVNFVGDLWYKLFADDAEYHMLLSDIGNKLTASEILCIKGKSDNEHEYYKQYFEV